MNKPLIAAVASVAFTACCAWFVNKYFALEARSIVAHLWPTSTAQQVEIQRLRQIAGWFALDCGYVPHREDAGSAIACARDALKAHRRFYVAFDFIGVDSRGAIGLASNCAGVVSEVTTDELGHGAFAHVGIAGIVRRTTVIRCKKPPVEQNSYPANRYLSCLAM
jgi:hypothetical protein